MGASRDRRRHSIGAVGHRPAAAGGVEAHRLLALLQRALGSRHRPALRRRPLGERLLQICRAGAGDLRERSAHGDARALLGLLRDVRQAREACHDPRGVERRHKGGRALRRREDPGRGQKRWRCHRARTAVWIDNDMECPVVCRRPVHAGAEASKNADGTQGLARKRQECRQRQKFEQLWREEEEKGQGQRLLRRRAPKRQESREGEREG
mmetsp:Transcript_55653/g.157911  ORF Transcript_55653/g.157911 Transcript_55653/m.157911 type:complete len:210 (+) Transcript_55653:666-1295(+)